METARIGAVKKAHSSSSYFHSGVQKMKDHTSTSRSVWFLLVITSILPLAAAMPFMHGEPPPGYASYTSDSGWDQCNNLVIGVCSAQLDYCSCNRPVFNVTIIPSSVTELQLGDLYAHEMYRSQCPPSCLLETSPPLPYRRNLTVIKLYDFWVAPHDRPFPVGRFLSNYKTTLKELVLNTVHLPSITKDTFAGFFALELLSLGNNRILTIAVDAFSALIAPGRMPGTFSRPQLTALKLYDNNLTVVDWTIFEPLADSLKSITLAANNLQRVYFSHFFTMPAIEDVLLSKNNLTAIDNQLLYSLAPYDIRPFLNIWFNPMCPADTQCHCSSMENLWEWYGKKPRFYTIPGLRKAGIDVCTFLPPHDSFTCGNYSYDETKPVLDRYVETDGESYHNCAAVNLAAKARNAQRSAKNELRNPINKFFPPSLRDYFLKITGALMKTS